MESRLRHTRAILFSAGLLFLTAVNTSYGVEKTPFLGRWDINIANTGDTFRSSWLEVTETEGKLSARLLWRWGSVTGVRSVEVVGDELRVTRTETYEEKPVDIVYAAKLVEGKLVGSVKNPDGSVFQWTGVPAVEKTDVSGTWQLTSSTPRRPITATLVLNQDGARVTGKYIGPRNREFPIQDGKLEGTKLTFSISGQRPERGRVAIAYSAEVRGDRMAGTTQSEVVKRALQFTAERQRKWADTVQLFNGKDLAGWKARDPNREFHWSAKDGALVNRPPDQDIVSEKRFQNFKLHVEFSLAKGSNSGIYLRGRYEMQLLDDYGKPADVHSNCSIYSRLAPSINASKRTDEWQTLDATLVGRWLTVVLNGQTVMDNVHLDGITGGALESSEAEPGPLMFQGDHGLVRFRKVEVTPALD